MKRALFIATLLAMVAGMAYAGPKNAFNQGDVVGQLAIGLGGLRGLYGTSGLPTISASVDFAVVDRISFGGLAAYSSSTYDYAYPYLLAGRYYSYRWRYSYFTIAGRGSYHFLEKNEKLDVYAGGSVGYNVVSSRFDGDVFVRSYAVGASRNFVHYGVHAGGRYYFMQRFAAFAEVGYGIGFLTVGISMKF
jgi:hypothetical protein